MRTRLTMMLVAVCAVVSGLLLPAPASAQSWLPANWLEVITAVTPDRCQFPKTWGVCGVVTNRVWVFGPTGGELVTTTLSQTAETTDSGNWVGPRYGDFPWNGSSLNSWSSENASTKLGGDATYKAAGVLGSAGTVKVVTKLGQLSGVDDPKFALSCPDATYLVCVLPKVWEKQINSQPNEFTGLATVESRPLIIKILNLTDQPLVRSSEARGTGVTRDNGTTERPATVPAFADGLAGARYYHYYRDTSVPNNVTVSYAFADGATATTLTGGVLDINVDVAADGSTSASACTPPEGLPLTVECKVTMLGTADGILTALVSVGV